MDRYRGSFSDHVGSDAEWPDLENDEDAAASEPPPNPIGQDERRMQVRAYNHWASLLGDRTFPSIEDLEPHTLDDFGPYSVLLDFTNGLKNPSVRYLGQVLAAQCGTQATIRTLADVPARSLLTRITDHYMQILANQTPIGFEAEFVNQHDATILYRGILLPFSSDNDTIDFIYGVINWKELADQETTDELLLEIDQALEVPLSQLRHDALTDWADGPAETSPAVALSDQSATVLDLSPYAAVLETVDLDQTLPELGKSGKVPDLAVWLASARQLAAAARGSEDRTRQALYAAISRAYDFSLAAAAAPEEFAALLAEHGLVMQTRAPMTPVVKLVFGTDYDKTRLTEYAAALAHAHRIGLLSGQLGEYLANAPGGLKGVVEDQRRSKRPASAPIETVHKQLRPTLAAKLRKMDVQPLAAVTGNGSEFALLVARRLPDGSVVLLGEVGGDMPLLERAARKLVA